MTRWTIRTHARGIDSGRNLIAIRAFGWKASNHNCHAFIHEAPSYHGPKTKESLGTQAEGEASESSTLWTGVVRALFALRARANDGPLKNDSGIYRIIVDLIPKLFFIVYTRG